MTSDGYIYVQGWDRFQHPDVVRSTRMPWIRNYVDLLENEDYLDLGASERALLECIWKWTGVCGNGRCSAKVSTLRSRFRLRNCNLEPLIQAGFIEVLASKAQAPRKHSASTEGEEGSKEPSKKEIESARANGGSSRAADAARHRVLLKHAIAGASNLIADLPPHLVEGTIKEAYPADLVPGILAGLPKPATKETSA